MFYQIYEDIFMIFIIKIDCYYILITKSYLTLQKAQKQILKNLNLCPTK